MKKSILFVFVAAVITSATYAQVQIDKSINLSGTTGNRKITNLETPVAGTDAVNKDYVDSKVAAGGGSSLTMVSNESASTMNFGDAVRYCKNLSESGYTDWRLASFPELTALISKGGTTVSSDASAAYFWLADRPTAGGAIQEYFQIFRLSDGYISVIQGSSAAKARCVR